MLQVLLRQGTAVVEEVPAPTVSADTILVEVLHSCISVGTEMASLNMSALPLYRRALKQPENVRRVFTMMRDQGVTRTLRRVQGQLAAGVASGYSAAGRVLAVGEAVAGFNVGDLVACAGAGIASHAEIINVPVNLAVRVPDGVDSAKAATVTLGAIAMQGVRRAAPTLGETFVVVGLGLLGQITVQLLAANGCRVIGVDPDAPRRDLAMAHGAFRAFDPGAVAYPKEVHGLTDGFGADGVVITASGPSDEIVSQAFNACRKRGRVALVGDVGLNLRRADMYAKELDFFISCSYGPGRYDPVYEEAGLDYPIGHVRWTENRNMAAYLDLIASGRIDIAPILGATFPVTRAGDAYAALRAPEKPLAVLLEYPAGGDKQRRKVAVAPARAIDGPIRVALVGAGSFAQGMHLPNMLKLRGDFALRAVMSRTGANAKALATQYEAAYATTDAAEVLADPDIDLVMIATRHDLHGALTLRALEAGKHVFVEKPLALDPATLDTIEAFFRAEGPKPMLLTGFNRRFSPAAVALKHFLAGRTGPFILNYQMNAGYIPLDHWVHGPEGGGRNIGEACHIYDLFNYLTGSHPVQVSAEAIRPKSRHLARNDNFVATLRYADGSLGTLVYTALGTSGYPKERLELFSDGAVSVLDDYKTLSHSGAKGPEWSAKAADKGQFAELQQVARCLRQGGPWPIALADQLAVTRASFAVEAQIAEIGDAPGAPEPSEA